LDGKGLAWRRLLEASRVQHGHNCSAGQSWRRGRADAKDER
jgi:hypothetical protein